MSLYFLIQVFEPSATATESEWFILDENGKRQRTMSRDEIEEVKHLIEESSSNKNNAANDKKGNF